MEIAWPMYALLVVFDLTPKCNMTFEKLKRALDWNMVFHVYIDASSFAIGSILAQLGDFPISCECRHLNVAEMNYITMEHEGLCGIRHEEVSPLSFGKFFVDH